jgi:hypothetical protein
MHFLSLLESAHRLGDLCDIAIGMEDADFWLHRRHDIDHVGEPTKEYAPEHIGIRVKRTDILLPDYLFYAMQYLQMRGYWKQHSYGMLKLVNIRVEDVKKVALG